ncbi:MAG TPA: hypothetical protein VHI13_06395 [Candidatus Kapabacteria bacterium]|nr:hypothetical protein [Candidatus Kapabacteria bacterium]
MKNNILNRIHWIKGTSLPCLILLALPGAVTGQNWNSPPGIAMAGAVTARTESPWFAAANPAATASDSARTFAAAFAPSALGIEGYRDGSAMASWRHDTTLALAATIGGVGALSYSEISAGIAGAYSVAQDVRIGVAFRLHAIAVRGYGAATAPELDAGFLLRLNVRMRAAAAVRNLTRSSIAGTPFPQSISLGVAFDLVPQTTVSFDIAHESERSAGASFGISHIPADRLTLRFGAGVTPERVAAGLSYAAETVLLEYGGSYVANVGMRHAIGVGLHW